MRISIIIPIYNEEKQIDRLWRDLMDLEPSEIVFVDGGSSDRTIEIVERSIRSYEQIYEKKAAQGPISLGSEDGFHKLKLLISPKKGRAEQMNFGAKNSSGEVLFFLHADSCPPQTAVQDIRSATQKAEWGCFRLCFSPNSLLMTCCGYLSLFRVKSRRILFGDQGIFIRRELFERLGGFASLPIMEDYELSIRIKKLGIKPVVTKTKICTSSRRFTQGGTLRTMYRMQKFQYMFRKGEDIEKIHRAYRDIR